MSEHEHPADRAIRLLMEEREETRILRASLREMVDHFGWNAHEDDPVMARARDALRFYHEHPHDSAVPNPDTNPETE